MSELRRGMRVAIVALKAFSLTALLLALSAVGSLISQLVKGSTKFVSELFVLLAAGLAATAVFYLLSEAGVVLLRLEEQQEELREQVAQLSSDTMQKRDEENK